MRCVRTLLLAAAFLLPFGPAQAHETEISIVGAQFVPAVAQGAVGEAVTWTSLEPAHYPAGLDHHAIVGDQETVGLLGGTALPDASPELEPGDSWSWTPNEAGTYAYRCDDHAWMRGVLIVAEEM